MEQGERPKRFITTLSFYHGGEEALTLEGAVTNTREVISCAEDHGLTLIDGQTNRSREREAVEAFTYGSETAYRNQRAEAEQRGEVWDPVMGQPRVASEVAR